jgi:hypothetical protein
MLTLRQKTENVLAAVFYGLHRVEMGKIKEGPGWLSLTIHRPLSTYDFDELTRLVVAAHDECVRVQIEAALTATSC